MADLDPSRRKVSREALDRIIQRATELQTSERELGDELSEEDVLALGKEVGLPSRYVQQAILEERNRIAPSGGMLTRLIGPLQVSAARTVPGTAEEVEAALQFWMVEEELLTVKRRQPQATSWEARSDFVASIKRGLGLGGKRYALSRAREIVGTVMSLEEGWCHVTLAADLTNTRNDYLAGAGVTAASGGMVTGIALTLGIFAPVAIVPSALGVVLGATIASGRRRVVERVLIALEQVLDRLERREITPTRRRPFPERGLLSKAIRDEVRKHLGA